MSESYEGANKDIKAIKSGDMIQLNTWFGDVWAEVLNVYISSDGEWDSVYYCHYSKYGYERCVRDTRIKNIRRVISKSEVPKGSIVYMADRKAGHYKRQWNTKLTYPSKYGSNSPERHPDYYEDEPKWL